MDSVTGYEFTESQNQELSHLHRQMRFLAYVLILTGSLVVISGGTMAVQLLFSDVPPVLAGSALMMAGGGVLMVFLGMMLLRAVSSFRAIVETRGSDITHLMDALGELRKFFTFAAALAVVMILAMLGVMALLIFRSSPAPYV